ncbi:MAG: hypothetical protein HY718_05580 [Planctomycetes bacterium]|nr:hypothetical protein [Planctomycetota bacterium]
MKHNLPAIVLVVCASATSAAATVPAGFMSAVDPIVLAPGTAVEVAILAASSGSAYGMSLYLETSAPFGIADLVPGDIWPSPPIIIPPPDPPLPPQFGVLFATTLAGPIDIPTGTVLAKVTIFAPIDMPIGATGWITTDSPTLGVPSDFIDPAPIQDTATIVVIPEPLSGVLLAAVGILLVQRRRRYVDP